MRIIPAIMFTLFAFSALPAIGQTEKTSKQTQSDSNGDSDDLTSLLEDDETQAKKKKDYTTATFKTTRIINGHSVENTGKGVLDFRISHRFGELNSGAREFFGLDNANTRIGFDYGVTDWLSVGIGRSSFDKEYDGFAKVRILRQTEDDKMPVTVSYVGFASVNDLPAPTLATGQEWHFSNRLYYANQVLLARKFSQAFSMQIMPTHIHYNLVDSASEPNDMFAIGVGGRLKLSSRISLNAEYHYLAGDKLNNAHNSLSVGFDIETGGHVFQLMLTNAISMTERSFIAGQSNSDWADGGIHFGFNISRVFTIVRPKGFENSRNRTW